MDEILSRLNSTLLNITLVTNDTKKAVNDIFNSGVQEIEFFKYSTEVWPTILESGGSKFVDGTRYIYCLLIKEFCERLYPEIKALEDRIFENSLEIELHFRQKWEPEFSSPSLPMVAILVVICYYRPLINYGSSERVKGRIRD